MRKRSQLNVDNKADLADLRQMLLNPVLTSRLNNSRRTSYCDDDLALGDAAIKKELAHRAHWRKAVHQWHARMKHKRLEKRCVNCRKLYNLRSEWARRTQPVLHCRAFPR